MHKHFNAHLTVRVPARVRIAFIDKAKRFDQPSTVLRELVEAFIEDRLTIKPPANRKESLYHE